MQYTNPGVAASNALEKFMAERDATRRQHLLDNITLQREQRLAQQDADEAEYRKAELEYRKNLLKSQQEDKVTALKEKRGAAAASRVHLGDIVDAPTKTLLDETGYSDAYRRQAPVPIAGGIESVPTPPMGGIRFAPPAGADTPVPEQPAIPPVTGGTPEQFIGRGTVQEQQQGKQEALRKKLADDIRQGVEPKEVIAGYLEAGGDPKEAEGIVTTLKGHATTVPGVGTFGDYLTRMAPGGDTSKLTTTQIEAARKKWMEEGRAPQSGGQGPQPQIFYDSTGKPHAIRFTGDGTAEIPLPEGIVGKTSPITGQIWNRVNASKQVGNHIDEIRAEIEEADRRGLLGPTLGRWNEFLAGRAGSTGDEANDVLLGKLRMDVSAIKSGFAMVHGGARGGSSITLAQRWDKVMDSGKMSKGELMGALDGIQGWLNSYATDPTKAEETKPASTDQKPSAADLIKKYSGKS